MKVVWLAPYPVQLLAGLIDEDSLPTVFHACSWIVNLSRALSQVRDLDLHLVTANTRLRRSHQVRSNNITFHLISSGLPFVQRGFPAWLPVPVLTGFYGTRRRLAAVVRGIQPDLVHAHGTEGAYTLAGLATGLPCLVSMQGIVSEIYKTAPSFQFRIVSRLERRQVRQARYFACRTDFDSGFVQRLNPAARIFHINEAMHPAFFGAPWTLPAEPRLLYVGGLTPAKGVEDLLHAIAAVSQSIAAVTLDVVGSGPAEYVHRLHDLVRRWKLDDRVRFLGQRTALEIAGYHRQAHLFVLPSLNENSPNALAEAMVSGMPVIATRVGGIPSMIEEDQTGFCVAPGNPLELAAKIHYVLTNPDVGRAVAARAAIVARARHEPQQVAMQTIAAYKQILMRERRGEGG